MLPNIKSSSNSLCILCILLLGKAPSEVAAITHKLHLSSSSPILSQNKGKSCPANTVFFFKVSKTIF